MGLDLFLITTGLGFLIVGIGFRLGLFKAYYWMQPFSYYRAGIYGLIPLGIVMLMLVVAPVINDTFLMIPFQLLLASLFFLSIFMWIFKPRFVKPDWVNWLEDNHTDIIPELRREMWHMRGKRKEIKEIINDQAKLEAWIEEFRRRRK